MKVHQIRFQTGQLGEVLVCSLFRGAWLSGKKSFDVKVPTLDNPRGHTGRIEVKTSNTQVSGGWYFNAPTRWQKRNADFLIWVCLGSNYSVRRLYVFPHGHFPNAINLTAKNEVNYAEYRWR